MELATAGRGVRQREVKSQTIIDVAPRRTQRTHWAVHVVLILSVVAGMGLRIAAYAMGPSLWIDEAMLALNVIHRTPTQLLGPLDLNQGAPVGFLMLSKLTVKLFGHEEFALRLQALIAGLTAMFLFIPLAYRLLDVVAARIAVCLFALSPYLIAYSAEFKQYELDATIAVGLLLLGQARRWLSLAIAGMLAVWFSHPSVFVLGGVGLSLLLHHYPTRTLRKPILVIAAWIISFGICYGFFLRKLGLNAYLLDYWNGTFMPLPPTSFGDLAWIVHHFLMFFEKPGGLNPTAFGAGGLAAGCWLVGVVRMASNQRPTLIALMGPFLLAMLASGLQKYPFAGRLLLFAVPGALLLVASGASFMLERLESARRGAGIAVLMLLFIAPLGECYWNIEQPPHREDVREAVEYLHQQWQPGDRLYVFYHAAPTFAYYAERYPFPKERILIGQENSNGPTTTFLDELRRLEGESRVWVLVAHSKTNEETAIHAYLDVLGNGKAEFQGSDVVLLRYDLRGR